MNYCIHCMNEIEQDARECPHCGKAQNAEIPAHHLLPGTLLQGRFLIGAALGEGGFGITYIGRDQQLDMRVAVKEYYPNGYATRSNTASPLISIATAGDRKAFFENGKDRFLREARVLARFSSEDGIVTVRDFFEANNTAYIVMEYLEGQTLREYLKKRGRMSAGQALNLMLPVMKSLREVHIQGLIHRDIAPDNIMLVNGKVKLLDFGAARNMSSIADKSLSVMLKPGYAPEEQYRSKGNQGPWTDVYALAATMYKCITGVTPDDSTQRLYSDELKSPSALGVTIAAQFEAAIMKGLAVLQQDRYQSIDEFLEGLEGNDAEETERSAAVPPAPAEMTYAGAGDTGRAESHTATVSGADRGPAAADKKAPAGKKRKVIIAAIAAGAAVLVAGVVLLTVLLGGKGKSRNADKTLKLSDNLYDTTFELDGVVYQLPMSFDKLTSDGWSIADSDYSESYKVGGYKSLAFPMRKKGAAINVEVYNTSGNARAIKDCTVFSVEGELASGSNIVLAKGIDCESGVDEIIAAFGKPAERDDNTDYTVLTYEKARTSGVRFICYSEESGMRKYSSITVENINFDDDPDTEVNDAVPKYLAKYKAPSSLDGELLSCKISIGGDLYQLPAPLSAFTENGWKVRENSGPIPAGDTKSISLERDGAWFYAELVNLADYQTVAGNCAVYRVSIDAERNIPVELAGGIVMNATTKAEVEEKVNSEYSVYNGSDYYSYTYTDYSGGFDLRLSIEVDKTSEKVSGITLSDKNWKY